jgi:SAM-dependent methyltransferase
MFFYTDTADAPWSIVKSDDKKRARLNCMRHFLASIDYPGKDHAVVGEPDPRIVARAAQVMDQAGHILDTARHPAMKRTLMSLPPLDWNSRYAGTDYLFGRAPAGFVGTSLPFLAPGSRVLCLADGEGRNGVGYALAGHRVTSMETSENAQAKARALAAEAGVTLDFVLSRIEDWDWTADAWDAVAAIFIQFAPPPMRAAIHRGIARTLRPGGLALIHGYAPRQVENGTGGPRDPAHLYTLEGLRADFPGWEVLREADNDATIAEGTAHVGRSALVDFIARKPG